MVFHMILQLYVHTKSFLTFITLAVRYTWVTFVLHKVAFWVEEGCNIVIVNELENVAKSDNIIAVNLVLKEKS